MLSFIKIEDNRDTEFYITLDKDWHVYFRGKKYIITSPPKLIEDGKWQYRIKEYIKGE